MLRVVKYQKQLPQIDAAVEETKVTEARIEAHRSLVQAMKPHAELTLLEVKKYDKAAAKQNVDAHNVLREGRETLTEAVGLEEEIEDVIGVLKNYGLNTDTGQVEVRQALVEARKILSTIRGRSYSKLDISVRTELSYARQALNSVKELLLDQQQLQQQGKHLERVEQMINDLLKYLNRAMDQTRRAFVSNDEVETHLNRAKSACKTINQLNEGSQQMTSEAETLLGQARHINRDASSSFARLQTIFDRLISLEGSLREKESGLSHIVETYRINQLLPCQAHARRLQTESLRVLNMFGSDLGNGAEKTLEAANAYQNIMRTVRQSRRAAEEAR